MPERRLDKPWVQRSFDRAADSYDEAAVLQREVADRLVARLDILKMAPSVVLDLGAGTGYPTKLLRQRYRKSRLLALDLAHGMLRRARKRFLPWQRPQLAVADAEALPLRKDSVDLAVSNLTLQWCEDVEAVFRHLHRCLRPGGALLFTTFGPDTLRELRQSWAAVDAASHVNRFMDMHDLGDAMVHGGLAEPVMDVEYIELTYADPMDLLRDIKAWGAHNVNADRARGMTGRRQLRDMLAYYRQHFAGDDGRVRATFEVVYGHAWAPVEKKQVRDPSGAVRVSLDSLKKL